LKSYDATNAPAGSIKVSTDFAIGTDGSDPWMRNWSPTSETTT
jgi:hypothetical protein